MLLTSLLLLFLFSSAVLGADDYRTCYYPNKKIALDHTPCSDDGNVACCSSNHICMTNGLCVNVGSNQPYGFSRAACTDLNWGTGCPSECTDREEDLKAGCAIIPFQANGNDTTYCCNAVVSNGSNAVCANDQGSFNIESGTAIQGRAYLSDLIAKDSDNNNNRDVAIGAGVGVPLGVLFLTALGWALFERKKRHALLNSAAAAAPFPGQQYGPGGQTMMPPQWMAAPGTRLQELDATKHLRPQELEAQ